MKYDKDANLIWGNYKIVNDCLLNHICLSSKEAVYVTGFYHHSTLSQSTTITGCYTNNGTEAWFYDYGNPNFDYTTSSGVQVDINNNCYVSGLKDTLTTSQEYKTLKYGISSGTNRFQNPNINGNNSILEVPKIYSLEQNYPNPFNPVTVIRYAIPESGTVKLIVYNMLGQEITDLVNEFKDAGYYNIRFDASKFSSGIYVYKIDSRNFTSMKKMVLVK